MQMLVHTRMFRISCTWSIELELRSVRMMHILHCICIDSGGGCLGYGHIYSVLHAPSLPPSDALSSSSQSVHSVAPSTQPALPPEASQPDVPSADHHYHLLTEFASTTRSSCTLQLRNSRGGKPLGQEHLVSGTFRSAGCNFEKTKRKHSED